MLREPRPAKPYRRMPGGLSWKYRPRPEECKALPGRRVSRRGTGSRRNDGGLRGVLQRVAEVQRRPSPANHRQSPALAPSRFGSGSSVLRCSHREKGSATSRSRAHDSECGVLAPMSGWRDRESGGAPCLSGVLHVQSGRNGCLNRSHGCKRGALNEAGRCCGPAGGRDGSHSGDRDAFMPPIMDGRRCVSGAGRFPPVRGRRRIPGSDCSIKGEIKFFLTRTLP